MGPRLRGPFFFLLVERGEGHPRRADGRMGE